MSPIDQITLRNRLLVATSMWKETIAEPLPRMPPGDPADQIQSFEIQLVDRLWHSATPENAREVADRTWDLVHDRSDDDPVKRRVVECHEALAQARFPSSGVEFVLPAGRASGGSAAASWLRGRPAAA